MTSLDIRKTPHGTTSAESFLQRHRLQSLSMHAASVLRRTGQIVADGRCIYGEQLSFLPDHYIQLTALQKTIVNN